MMQPPTYKYCPECGEQYNCTYYDHKFCLDCEVELVDEETYQEIKDKEERMKEIRDKLKTDPLFRMQVLGAVIGPLKADHQYPLEDKESENDEND